MAHGATARIVALILTIASLAGCSEDQVSRYQAPKDPPPPKWADESAPRLRMIVAMVPHAEDVWFFKLMGSDRVVTLESQAFEKFIRSTRFTDQPAHPVTWTTPPTWQEEGPSGSREATFRIAADGKFAELTVTRLGREASDVLANVNRWRGQLGLEPINDVRLAAEVEEIQVPAGRATVVDLTSAPLAVGPPAAREPAIPPGGPAVADRPRPGVEYDTPPGWSVSDQPVQMAVATLQVGEGDNTAQVTVVPLPGSAGGLLSNLNRWRTQVGLKPLGLEALGKGAQKLEVDGRAAQYVKFYGPESAGAGRQGLLGVVTAREGTSWFIKMKGPATMVAAEEKSFEKFVRSLRFGSMNP